MKELNLRDQLFFFLSLRDGHYKSHWTVMNDGIKFETNQCPRQGRGAFHLVKNSENSGSGLNWKTFSRFAQLQKFPAKVELLRR